MFQLLHCNLELALECIKFNNNSNLFKNIVIQKLFSRFLSLLGIRPGSLRTGFKITRITGYLTFRIGSKRRILGIGIRFQESIRETEYQYPGEITVGQGSIIRNVLYLYCFINRNSLFYLFKLHNSSSRPWAL